MALSVRLPHMTACRAGFRCVKGLEVNAAAAAGGDGNMGTERKMTPEIDLAVIADAMLERLRACNSRIRLEILGLLLAGPMNVSTLAARSGLDMPAVSRHLARLRGEGLVVYTQQSNRRIYALSRAVRIEVRDLVVHIRLSTAEDGTIAFGLPLRLVKRLHPGWSPAAPNSPVKVVMGNPGAALEVDAQAA